MKNSFLRSKASILVCLLLLSVLSCQRDEPEATNKTGAILSPEVRAAKQWLEQRQALYGHSGSTDSLVLTRLKATESTKKSVTKAKPQWEKAWVGKDKVVEVPLSLSNKVAYSSNPNATDAELGAQLTRLVVLQARQGESFAVLMHIMADADYLEKCGYSLESNKYKNMARDFSGSIIYTYLDGTYCYGWRYRNGKIIGTVNAKGIVGAELSDTRLTRSGGGCTEMVYIEFTQYCWYTPHNGREHCTEWEETYRYYWDDCVDDGSGGGGGGVPDDGDPKPKPVDPCITVVGLNSNTGFEDRIKSLYESANNETLENGYMLKSNGEVQPPKSRTAGNISFSYNSASKYTENMHSHSVLTGGSPSFSAGDIAGVYFRYANGYMDDPATFINGVVSGYGCMLVQITDFGAFEAFAEKYELADTKKKLESAINDNKKPGSLDEVIGNYVQFMANENSGLTFIFREQNDDGTHDDWQVKEVQNGNIISKRCQ